MPQRGFSPFVIIIIATILIGAGVGSFFVLREKKALVSQEVMPQDALHEPEENALTPFETPAAQTSQSVPAPSGVRRPPQKQAFPVQPETKIAPEPKAMGTPQPAISPSEQLVTLRQPSQMDCGNDINNGAEIVAGPSGHAAGDRDNPFRSLTIHPTNPDILLIGTERNGFVKSTDGGNTWERLRYGLWHVLEGYPEIYDISMVNTNPAIVYAATTLGGPGPLTGSYPSSGGGVYKSSDGGKTWQRKNCGIQRNGGRTIAVHVDPRDGNRALIGVAAGETSWYSGAVQRGTFFPGGIYITIDGAENWMKVMTAQHDERNEYKYIRSARSNPSLLYTFGFAEDASLNVGFLKSADNGTTWQQFAPELRSTYVSHFDISHDGRTIYAMVDGDTGGTIWKSTDGGTSWSSYPLSTSGYTITVSPSDVNRVLFGKVDGLYVSTNGLQSEHQVISIGEEQRMSDVQFAPSNPNIVYAITQGSYWLYKSTDAGEMFTKIKDIRDDVLNALP